MPILVLFACYSHLWTRDGVSFCRNAWRVSCRASASTTPCAGGISKHLLRLILQERGRCGLDMFARCRQCLLGDAFHEGRSSALHVSARMPRGLLATWRRDGNISKHRCSLALLELAGGMVNWFTDDILTAAALHACRLAAVPCATSCLLPILLCRVASPPVTRLRLRLNIYKCLPYTPRGGGYRLQAFGSAVFALAGFSCLRGVHPLLLAAFHHRRDGAGAACSCFTARAWVAPSPCDHICRGTS